MLIPCIFFLAYIKGRTSPSSSYNQNLVSMDQHNEFVPSDATGFINILAVRLKEFSKRFKKNDEYIHCKLNKDM